MHLLRLHPRSGPLKLLGKRIPANHRKDGKCWTSALAAETCSLAWNPFCHWGNVLQETPGIFGNHKPFTGFNSSLEKRPGAGQAPVISNDTAH